MRARVREWRTLWLRLPICYPARPSFRCWKNETNVASYSVAGNHLRKHGMQEGLSPFLREDDAARRQILALRIVYCLQSRLKGHSKGGVRSPAKGEINGHYDVSRSARLVRWYHATTTSDTFRSSCEVVPCHDDVGYIPIFS